VSSARRLLWWTTLALSVAAWTLLVPLYAEIAPWLGVLFLLLAGLAGAWAAEGRSEEPAVRRPLAIGLLVLAAIGAGLFSSWGLRAALGMLTCGLVLSAYGGRSAVWVRVRDGFLVAGGVATAQGASAGLYMLLAADAHGGGAYVLSRLAAVLLRLLGRSVTLIGRTLYVSTTWGPTAVLPTRDHFGLVIGLLLLVGFLSFVLIADEENARRRLRVALVAVLVTVVYLVARYVFVLLLALESGSPRLFWDPIALCLSFLPLTVVLACFSGFVPRGLGTSVASRAFGSRAGTWLSAGASFVATVSLLACLFLVPAGSAKDGDVLFDEAHGEWETTVEPMRTDEYGLVTTYNYASLADWLTYYTTVGHLTEPIDEESLRDASILVLKTPSVPYTANEIDAIEAFVRRGGGLFVIGDHTNVFGTTTALNPILERFDLALNYDSTYRLESGSFTVYTPSEPRLDPIMQHVDQFDFLTSCSIRVPLAAYRTIADDRILSNQADYATRDFFPRERYNMQSQFGRFAQAAAVQHGAGRVVVFADSTCFSNFSVFMDGYPSFLLGTFAFLSRTNTRVPVRLLAACTAGLAVILLLGAVWRGRRLGFGGILIGVLLGWALFSWSACKVHAVWYELPTPAEDIPYVYFDLDISDIAIEPQPASADAYDAAREFDTLFVWTQRVQLIPQLVRGESRGGVLPGHTYVIINPRSGLVEDVLFGVRSYIEEGGTLVLLDCCGREASGSVELLSSLGLELAGVCGSERVLVGGATAEYEVSPSLSIAVSQAFLGGGRVIVISDSTAFSNLSLGGAFTVPSGVQEVLYNVWFEVLLDVVPRDGGSSCAGVSAGV